MQLNAKQEFIAHVEGLSNVLCATLSNETEHVYNLHQGYSKAEYDAFVNSLDFTYDSGYGGQELYGTIWYADGTWSSRGEYDGSEWWEHNVCPDIPNELKESK